MPVIKPFEQHLHTSDCVPYGCDSGGPSSIWFNQPEPSANSYLHGSYLDEPPSEGYSTGDPLTAGADTVGLIFDAFHSHRPPATVGEDGKLAIPVPEIDAFFAKLDVCWTALEIDAPLLEVHHLGVLWLEGVRLALKSFNLWPNTDERSNAWIATNTTALAAEIAKYIDSIPSPTKDNP